MNDDHLARIRRICSAFPDSTEKLSHGEPTFFTRKKVYAMFSNNHHHDGHIAVMVPVAPGLQATLLKTSPRKYYYPPYVGVKGWIGIELAEVSDSELEEHLMEAWQLITTKAGAKRRAAAKRRA